MMKRPLTPKQEKFAQLYVELGNASEAYRRSYNASRMKPATVNRMATANLDNHKIAARVAELQAVAAERHEVTVDSLTKELEDARARASSKKQMAAAVSAIMGKAKLHGFLTDKLQHSVSTELAELMREIDGRTRGLPSG